MLEVSAVRLHTCTKTLARLVNWQRVDVTPHLLQLTLFQFVSVVHSRLVYSLWTTLQMV